MTWRETWLENWRRIEALPDGQVKDFFKGKLQRIRFLLEILDSLPAADPFRDRVAALPQRMQEVVPPDLEAAREVEREFLACVLAASRTVN